MLLDRRKFLTGAGAFGLSLGGTVATLAQPMNPDYTIKIAPMSVELAPGKAIEAEIPVDSLYNLGRVAHRVTAWCEIAGLRLVSNEVTISAA